MIKDKTGRYHDDGNGRFISKNKSDTDKPKVDLTRQEFAKWYQALGDIQRGMFCHKDDNGNKMIVIGKKLVFASGSYANPKIKKVMSFKHEEEIEEFLKRF